MSRKIIIITRDTDYVGNEAIVKKMPQREKRGKYPSGCFSGFESLYKKPFYAKDEQDKEAIQLTPLGLKLKELGFSDEYLDEQTDWLDGKHELAIDEKLVEVFKKIAEIEPCRYMDQILLKENDENDEVYLFYWNKTKKTVKDTWRMLALICKDCGIDFSNTTEEENMLYIHDDEWGATGNEMLILDRDVMSDTNKELLEQLKIKFSFVASFQHNNAEGMFFKDILRCKFGNDMPSNLLGEKEKESTTFGILREACINILTKENKEK